VGPCCPPCIPYEASDPLRGLIPGPWSRIVTLAKNVIVTGMARSGTSMTVAALRRYGYWVAEDEGAELQSADRFNPSGYWERSAILDANRAVLKAAGFEHDNTWMFDPISPAIAKKISELTPLPVHRELVARYREHQPWVWKDPRFCFTLPYWLKLLDPKEIAVLLVLRNEDEIVRSFRRVQWRRDQREEPLRRCILQHWEAARSAITSTGVGCVEIHYSDFSKRPRALADAISEQVGVRLDSDGLGYRSEHNTSSLLGRIRWGLEAAADTVPSSVRKAVKRVTKR